LQVDKTIINIANPDISPEALLSYLHIGYEDDLYEDIMEMHQQAIEIAVPIALYKPFIPEARDENIWLEGVSLIDPFVYEMLSNQDIVVAYVASCGQEIEAWSKSFGSGYDKYAADVIKQMCLGVIRTKLFEEAKEKHFCTDKTVSTINPGSLIEWPIQRQESLFNALGGVTDDIGVELADSFLLYPTKSISGIMFETDEAFHNCQLCPRENCPGRRAEYSKAGEEE